MNSWLMKSMIGTPPINESTCEPLFSTTPVNCIGK